MCFELRKSDIGTKPKIAEQDIIIYKVITKYNFGWAYSLKIDGQYEKWTQGYIYSESDPFDIHYNYIIKGRCFHSSKTLSQALKMKSYNYKIVKMIIPKGSKYYENDIEYVSDTIYYPLQNKK